MKRKLAILMILAMILHPFAFAYEQLAYAEGEELTVTEATYNNIDGEIDDSIADELLIPDDVEPPNVSDDTLTVGEVTYESVELSWEPANDTVTESVYLEYQVVYSKASNIGTLDEAVLNGTVAGDWTAAETAFTVTGLEANTNYYFNVLVRDEAGNKAAYRSLNQKTPANYGGARAEYGGENGTELFLGGNYIELGISNWGDFGTEGDKPDNFRGTLGGETNPNSGSNQIGMSADHDGYGQGHDLPIDYYMPGTPEERFAVGYRSGGSSYSNSNSAQMGAHNMATTVENQSQISKDKLKAEVVSTWAGTMKITQVISFNKDDKYYRNEVTITNISDSAWDSARYMRTFDPDNTVYRGGSYSTDNTVTHTVAADGKAVVKAETFSNTDPLYTALGTRAPIFFFSSDRAAVASVFGFINMNPYEAGAYEAPQAKGATIRNDVAITMTWDSGVLAAGASKTFAYYTSLDERDFSQVQKEIVVADIKEDIDNIEDMDDVKAVKSKIDSERDLDNDTKAELNSELLDVIVGDDAGEDIVLRDDEDVNIVNDIIKDSDKSSDKKDDARVELVEKAIVDIDDFNEEVTAAVQEVVDDIVDPDKKAEAQSLLDSMDELKRVMSDLKQKIEDASTMDDVRVIQQLIEDSELPDGMKDKLYSLLVDKVLKETGGIDITSAEDIELIAELIAISDKSPANKDKAWSDLVNHAIAELGEPTEELVAALQTVIDGIKDDDKQEDAQTKLDDWGKAFQQAKDKAALEQKIKDAATMDDVEDIKQLIEDSSLTDSMKKDLYGKLADKVLEEDGGIDLGNEEDIALVDELIAHSNKTDEEKDHARGELVDQALVEIVEITEKIKEQLQDVIDSIEDEDVQAEAQLKLDIETATTMDDVKALKEAIDTSDLSDDVKEELYGKLVDKVLKENGGIDLKNEEDIALVDELIENSGKTTEEKDEARGELVEQALAEIEVITEAIEEALQDVIDSIQDEAVQEKAQLQLDIETATTMGDVKVLKEEIDASGLPDDVKKELYGKLADKVLEQDGGIDLRNEEDIALVNELIAHSDKTDDKKDEARGELVDQALVEIPEITNEIKEALQDVIDLIQDEVAHDEEQVKLGFETAKDMEDVQALKETIEASKLPDDVKKELYGKLVDKVLERDGGIDLRNGDDIALVNELIENSDKTNDEKNEARGELVDHALAEIPEITNEIKEALQDVIDLIQDEVAHDEEQVKLGFETAKDMENVQALKETIEASKLPDDVKKELYGKLADKVLEQDGGIDLGDEKDIALVDELISHSNKTNEAKNQARFDLVDHAIAEISVITEAIKEQLQVVIDSIVDEDVQAEAQLKLDIETATTMDDVKVLKEAIDTSDLPDDVKEELYGKLVDKVLKENSVITLGSVADVAVITELIQNSDKGETAQDEALTKLVVKAIKDLSADKVLTNEEREAIKAAIFKVSSEETQTELLKLLNDKIRELLKGSSSSSSSTASTDAQIIINGKSQTAGTQTVIEEGGKTIVQLTVNSDVLLQKLNEIQAGTTSDNTVEILVASKGADEVQAILTGDIIKAMAQSGTSLIVNAGDVQYIIPAKQFGIETVAAKLGVDPSELRSIQVVIHMNQVDEALAAKISKQAQAQGYTLLLPPVEFEIIAQTTTASGKVINVAIDQFTDYVSRVLKLPDGMNGNQITTGIVYNTDGTISHIPTEVFEQNSAWYAKLNSMTNSLYSVIWNPTEVASVAGHWSKQAVNDMASRLVVKNPEGFVPDGSITRGDFAEYITKALGLYRTGVAKSGQYSDVTAADEGKDAIAIATAYGIIKGYPDGTFKPDAAISREEAMVMYARAMSLIGLQGTSANTMASYSDQDKVAAWAYAGVKQTVEGGVFTGRSETKLAPQGIFTYAEAATAVRNLLVQAELINY